jgi:hypothetical protein
LRHIANGSIARKSEVAHWLLDVEIGILQQLDNEASMPPDPNDLWHFLWIGYLFTVAIEFPILLIGLSPRHRLRDRLLAAIWVNACTYPIVVLVLPYVVWVPLGRIVYLAVAETFAPVAECSLFWLAFGSAQERFRISMYRDFAEIIAANLASFLLGVWWFPTA